MQTRPGPGGRIVLCHARTKKIDKEADFLTLFFMMHTAQGPVRHKEVFPKSQDFCWVLFL